jgi:hypothetical protein
VEIKLVWTIKEAPQEQNEELHELGLGWYRFKQNPGDFEKSIQAKARPAVWIHFSQIEELDRIQGAFPDAPLGPASSFTEALIFADSLEEGEALKKRITRLLEGNREVDEMEALLREDTMEDY